MPHRVGVRSPCPVCNLWIYPASRSAHERSKKHRLAHIRQTAARQLADAYALAAANRKTWKAD